MFVVLGVGLVEFGMILVLVGGLVEFCMSVMCVVLGSGGVRVGPFLGFP